MRESCVDVDLVKLSRESDAVTDCDALLDSEALDESVCVEEGSLDFDCDNDFDSVGVSSSLSDCDSDGLWNHFVCVSEADPDTVPVVESECDCDAGTVADRETDADLEAVSSPVKAERVVVILSLSDSCAERDIEIEPLVLVLSEPELDFVIVGSRDKDSTVTVSDKVTSSVPLSETDCDLGKNELDTERVGWPRVCDTPRSRVTELTFNETVDEAE